MDKLYKDNEGNVYSFSPIQSPPENFSELTQEEITEHLKRKEQTKEEKAEQLKLDIRELELKQIRSLKAMMSDTATEEDEVIYNEIEAEIIAKRQEIRWVE